MNETLQAIKNRRSIRSFKPEQISDTDLKLIMEAVLYAPNGMNLQKWHFTVIQNKDLLDQMVGSIKETIMKSGNEFFKQRASDPSYNTFYNAPTVIMLSGEESAQLSGLDCAMAAQTIALAAESLDLGSCVMTTPGFLFADGGSEWKEKLGIPQGYKHIICVALGYKNMEPAVPPRNESVINYIK